MTRQQGTSETGDLPWVSGQCEIDSCVCGFVKEIRVVRQQHAGSSSPIPPGRPRDPDRPQ